MKTNIYRNYLADFGISDDKARERCEEIFNTLFHGSKEERIYDEFGEDAANDTLCDVQDGKVSVSLLEKYLYKK